MSEHGNNAATREALERLDEHLYEDDYDGHLFFDLFDYDPKEEIRTALSTPARNCDRFADEEDAFAAWHDSLNDGDIVSVRNVFAWLFAEAEGKEDAND